MGKHIDNAAAWVEIDGVRHTAEIVERSAELTVHRERGPGLRKARALPAAEVA